MRVLRLSTLAACLIPFAGSCLAATGDGDAERIARLEQQVAAQQEQIARLERLIGGQGTSAPASAEAVTLPAPKLATAAPSAPREADAFRIPGLDVSGDLRLREEFNFSDRDARDRSRTVLRARLRASYAISSHFTVGAQVATGDPDDPNSTDITLTGLDDDLDISLDQAWIRYVDGGLTLYGGKFPQIFARTDMVWDGDVVPEGVGGIYAMNLGRGAKLDARAMYFIVDEAAAAADSHMLGAQAVPSLPLAAKWKASLVASYYGYHLRTLAGADSGDFRSNLSAGGKYLSDFRLVEGLATLTWSGMSERWPVALTADYVRNLGAKVPSDSGFEVDLVAGRSARRGDWRVAYTYSQVGVDAVFAAFSHDNIGLATNYRLHGLGLGYMLGDHVMIDGVFYHYRPLDAAYAGANMPHDWLDRVRLNLSLTF